LIFFSNFVGRFWTFFTEGLAFFEKIILATLVLLISGVCQLQQQSSWDSV